jgi:hypothetical protein
MEVDSNLQSLHLHLKLGEEQSDDRMFFHHPVLQRFEHLRVGLLGTAKSLDPTSLILIHHGRLSQRFEEL